MNTIAILNQKGGTGKTTTATSLAGGLAYQNRETLLVDLDPQSHSSIGLDAYPETSQETIVKVFNKRGLPIQQVISPTYIEHLDIVPAHIGLAKTAEEMHTKIGKETYLRESLATLPDTHYQYCILDCPPNLGVLTVNALATADLLVVPCQTSRYSLDGLSDLMDVVEEVTQAGLTKTPEGPDIRILLTMYDVRNKVTNDFILEQLEPFKDKLFETRIRKNEALNQAQITQETIFDYDPDSKGAKNYHALTQELINHYEQAETI